MDHGVTKGMRIGGMALLAAAFIGGACGESVAQAVERNSTQSRVRASHLQARAQAPAVAASSDQQAGLGQMRYYGGPKSPMWRGPSTN
jgi:hypothetical protein